MSTPKTSEKILRETLEAYRKFGSDAAAAEALGLKRSTFQSRRRIAENELPETNDVILPNLPSSELSAEEIMEHACKHFITHHTANSARRWMEIKVTTNSPIGVCFMGDPHIDNNGCNWPLLKRDISILEKTKGMHAVNIGDLTDNWVGRLLRLYADQEMSKKEAWKLAKYLLRDCKISWLCHLLGNHDSWGDGAYLIKATAHPTVPVEDWQSRFQIVFPNGQRIKVHAAHDFPGSSIWNKMHGPQKASMLYEEADIYACGHKHEWGINTSENAQRDFIYHLIRARGYKFLDSFSSSLGHASQKYGASITAVIDPKADRPNKVTCFPDLEEAAEFLTWKRSK